MLKLRSYLDDEIVELNPCDIVSITMEKVLGFRKIQVETKDNVYLCDYVSPADEEPIQL